MSNHQVLHMDIVWSISGKDAEDQIAAIKAKAEPLLKTADASNTYRTFGELWVPVGKQVLIPSLRYFTPQTK